MSTATPRPVIATVRRAGAPDLDAIAPLFAAYRAFYGRPHDPVVAREFIGERLGRGESVILLALHERGEAVGFTQSYPSFSSVRAARIQVLNDLFVVPHARRAGVARQLLAAAAQFARAAGAASLTLSTGVDNAAAQRLYESAGWRRDDGFVEYHLPL